ncbi:MAG: bifunctional riboflavin kinase/FAD synthetase [Candidatus Muirbacterium halophilum]|nr:bifunctional riboflavin kinase/FAD synthetase [Candidatus Muirbacterium halophilum]MCK9475675.1 bifunctional riboflavin kinase/FAD synthetase [Candidatus Muirbacterium halophilum]
MSILKNIKQNLFKECNIAIGNFDGVHKGHRFLLNKLIELSKADNIPSVVFSFYNHPLIYINKLKTYYITEPDEKLEIIENAGVDYIISPFFDDYFKNMDKKEFILFLIKNYNPKRIIVGENFNFGYQRKGQAEDILDYFKENAIIIKPVEINGNRISSSKIRQYLREHNIKHANLFLGYNYFVQGIVKKGNMLGNQLGVPTLNIENNQSGKLVPFPGVYITKTHIDNEIYSSITNIGGAPTINFEKDDKIETYVFDKKLENMYNKKIKVEFLEFLREERKFEDLNELRINMMKDIENAKKIITNWENT